MKVHEIEAKIADLLAESDAIDTVMADAKRTEPNEMEAARKLEIHGKDGKSGLIGCPSDSDKKIEASGLYAQLEFAKNVEAVKKAQAAPKAREVAATFTNIGDASDIFSQVVVPRTAQRKSAKYFADNREAFACGQWLGAAVFGNEESRQWCLDNGLDFRADMSTGDSSKGGFLVPEPMEAAIIRIVEERGVFRRFARPYPMTAPVDHHPRREAGLTGYWVGENTEVTSSDPTLGDVELVAKTLAALTKISKRFNMTSAIAIADWLAQEMAYTIADKEDEAGFNGDGTSTYGGVTGLKSALAAGSIHDAPSGNVSFATFDVDDFQNAAAELIDATGVNPRWFISKKGYHKSMGRLKNAMSGTSNKDLAEGSDQQFDGDDVVFANVLPKTDAVSTIQAYYGDLSMAATLGTLQGFSVESNGGGEYFKKLQIAIMGYEDVAINVHDRGTATVGGTIIGLKTAAS